jgi:hypothetical protein
MKKRTPVFREVFELYFAKRALDLETRELDFRIRGVGLESLGLLLAVRLVHQRARELDVHVLELDLRARRVGDKGLQTRARAQGAREKGTERT